MLKFAIASVSAHTNTQSAVSTFRHGATQNYIIIHIYTRGLGLDSSMRTVWGLDWSLRRLCEGSRRLHNHLQIVLQFQVPRLRLRL